MALTENDLSIISNAAAIYAKELLGYSLVILYKDSSTSLNSYTVHFNERNFMHLTGVCHKSIENYNTGRFFHLALERRLDKYEFEMANRHTTPRKLEVIEATLKNVPHAYMIGTYNNIGPLLITDRIIGNIYSCVGFTADEYNGLNYPNTLLKGILSKVRDPNFSIKIMNIKEGGVHVALHPLLKYNEIETVNYCTSRIYMRQSKNLAECKR